MTPAQMRQLAATRFMSVSKKEWQEQAAQALLDAADQIEQCQANVERARKDALRDAWEICHCISLVRVGTALECNAAIMAFAQR